METKRLVLVIGLSLAVMFGWQSLMTYLGYVQPNQPKIIENNQNSTSKPINTTESSANSIEQSQDSLSMPLPSYVEAKNIYIETPLYKAVLSSNGGVLKEFKFKKYSEGIDSQEPVNFIDANAAKKYPFGVLLDGQPTWATLSWSFDGDDLKLNKDETGVIKLVGQGQGVIVERNFIFSGDNYLIKEDFRIKSDTYKESKIAFSMDATAIGLVNELTAMQRISNLFFGGQPPAPEESAYNLTRVAWVQDGSLGEESSVKDLGKEGKLLVGNISWAGIMNNYFIGAVSMEKSSSTNLKADYIDNVYRVYLGKTNVTLEPGSDVRMSPSYYIGPKIESVLKGMPNELDKSLSYGFFSIIAKPLVLLLKFLFSVVNNYGIAIIIMTIFIKIVFWPLSQKSYRSMEEMRRLQPEIAKLREKYADDKESMNKEVMKLYKTYKVNPAGGCVPILLQIPVFFGLYQALLNSIELRHASFIDYLPFTNLPWLADLSAKDPYFILPLIMGASMVLQQKVSPAPADPTQAKIMMFMPVVFTLIFLNFPSGLVLYWLVNNMISIGQQWYMHKSKKQVVS